MLTAKVSFKSIYTWIYRGFIEVTVNALRRRCKSQGLRETRGKFRVGHSIKQRPKEIKKPTTFGHWELDTIVSGRGKNKTCLAKFVERKSRFYWDIKIPDRTSLSMQNAITAFIELMPKNSIKTFTVDRGKEFICYKYVEENLNIPMCFADRTHLGNVAQTKTQTDYLENFTLKDST